MNIVFCFTNGIPLDDFFLNKSFASKSKLTINLGNHKNDVFQDTIFQL